LHVKTINLLCTRNNFFLTSSSRGGV